jgi:hypothetical protein
MLPFSEGNPNREDDECKVRKLSRVEYNPELVSLVDDLQKLVSEAKLRWVGCLKGSSSAELLGRLSIDLVLLKRFISEDNLVVVDLFWLEVESLKSETFAKAFYSQKELQVEAMGTRQRIINTIIEKLKHSKAINLTEFDAL